MKQESSFNPTLKTIAGLILSVGVIGSAFGMWFGINSKVEAYGEAMPKFWEARSMVLKHEVIIPIIQQDQRDIKADVSEIRKDVKELLILQKGRT